MIGAPWRPYDVTFATRCLTCGIVRLLEKLGKSEEYSKQKDTIGANKIFCFFSDKKFFTLVGFTTKVRGGNNNSPLTLVARKKFHFFKKREIHFVSKL